MPASSGVVAAYWTPANDRDWTAFADLESEEVGDRRDAASWIPFTNADGTVQPGLCFFELGGDGRVVKVTDFWSDPCDLARQRAHLVERH